MILQKQFLIAILSLTIGGFAVESRAAGPAPFVCQEYPTVEQNEKFLDSLDGQVMKLLDSKELPQSPDLMGQLLRQIICIYQIQGSLDYVSYVLQFEKNVAFIKAKVLLPSAERERLDQMIQNFKHAQKSPE